MAEQPLSDLRVLDLTHHIAGPYCTKLLAAYGAEVIKVERPGTGDPARHIGPFLNDEPHPEKSGLFLHLNTGKKSITLDLKSPTGVRVLKEMVAEADVLVENFAPRVMPSLGLSYEELEKINARLVMTSISNFGQTGPYRDYKAKEIVSFAMGGRMYSEGQPDREPLKYAGNVAQYLAGTVGALATMTATIGSRLMGFGQHVDVSIQECMMAATDSRLLQWEYCGEEAEREARREGNYPTGVYFCQDGYIQMLGAGERRIRRVFQMLGMPELMDDPRFATGAARLHHQGDFEAIFLPWLLEHTREEVFHQGQAAGVPVAPLYTMDEVLKDPQFVARGFFTEVDHPYAGTLTYPGPPFHKMSETPWQGWTRAPLLGEHNKEVYCGRLGYSKEDLVRLRACGVI